MWDLIYRGPEWSCNLITVYSHLSVQVVRVLLYEDVNVPHQVQHVLAVLQGLGREVDGVQRQAVLVLQNWVVLCARVPGANILKRSQNEVTASSLGFPNLSMKTRASSFRRGLSMLGAHLESTHLGICCKESTPSNPC
jgi:hypothetical protein